MNTFKWLNEWYQAQCDGNWEHQYGIAINTIDNPGWSLSIDLIDTDLEGIKIEYSIHEKNENNWYSYRADKFNFEAFGDPSKLETLILKFKEIVENKN